MSPDPAAFNAHSPRFLGVVTPSGNTVVERVTMAVLGCFPGVVPLFSRTPVHGASDPNPTCYAMDDMLAATRLLSHARPEVLVWNGSKGAKIGLQHDHDFVARAQADTGIATTTSVIAMQGLLRRHGWRRVALVTPYDATYQQALIGSLRQEGLEVTGESHAGLKDNLSYASADPQAVAALVRSALAPQRPDALLVLCTNYPAAPVLPALEAETGVPMIDSTSVGVWAALACMGIDTRPGRAWGRIFDEAPLQP